MNLPQNIQGAIFDLDGTLLDSLQVWHDVDIRFFAKRKIPMPADYQDAIKTLDLYDAARYTIATYNLPEQPENLVKEWLTMVGEEYAERVELKPHAKELLETLYSRGIKLGVATSSAREIFLPCLKRHGIAQLFTTFTETTEAAHSKDFPDVYLLAAKRLGIELKNCAVFEDILVGIKSAKSGGFFTVAIADSFSQADEDALKAEADLFVHSFKELL